MTRVQWSLAELECGRLGQHFECTSFHHQCLAAGILSFNAENAGIAGAEARLAARATREDHCTRVDWLAGPPRQDTARNDIAPPCSLSKTSANCAAVTGLAGEISWA